MCYNQFDKLEFVWKITLEVLYMSKNIMVDDLIEQMNNFKSQKDVAKFIEKYKSVEYLPMIMMYYADELRNKSKNNIAILMYLEMAENKHLKYHIEFFRKGFNAIVKLWLEGGCIETPEEMQEILQSEYRGR